jgi:hypothetical protein
MTTHDPTSRPDERRDPVEGPADSDSSNRARTHHPAGVPGDGFETAFSFESQKQRAADALDGLAESARGASRELRTHAERWAHSIDTVAAELQRWADGLRTMPVGQVADDVADFARRRPGVVVSGAALVALGVAVYLQATREQREDEAWPAASYGRHA